MKEGLILAAKHFSGYKSIQCGIMQDFIDIRIH